MNILNETRWDSEQTWLLVNVICNDDKIRQGLFPRPGEDTHKINGKPKTDFQWMLAIKVFGDHTDFGPVIHAAKTTKDKTAWNLKIKNPLDKYVMNLYLSCFSYNTAD